MSAARGLVLSQADVVLLVGCRLNWMFHFGQPPRWSSNVKIIQARKRLVASVLGWHASIALYISVSIDRSHYISVSCHLFVFLNCYSSAIPLFSLARTGGASSR